MNCTQIPVGLSYFISCYVEASMHFVFGDSCEALLEILCDITVFILRATSRGNFARKNYWNPKCCACCEKKVEEF